MPLTAQVIWDACGLRGSLEATEAMIKEQGAPAVATWLSEYGLTALHVALLKNPDKGVLRALVRAGVDMTARCDQGFTVLHFARNAEAVGILVEGGASCAARDQLSQTSLHHACLCRRPKVAEAILKACGGIPRVVLAKSRGGKTARDIAASWCPAMVPILEGAMEDAEVCIQGACLSSSHSRGARRGPGAPLRYPSAWLLPTVSRRLPWQRERPGRSRVLNIRRVIQ